MKDDVMTLKGKYFTLQEICVLLKKVDDMGIPLEVSCWIEKITIEQLERLVNGVYDC